MSTSSVLCGAALAAVLLPSIGFAQSAPMTTPIPPTPVAAPPTVQPPAAATAPAGTPSAPPKMSAAARAAVDQRIRTLQSQLGITAAQMPLWSTFAQAMRDSAANTEALFAQRADAVAEMNAVDNMHSYAQIARAYADNTERLATAFDSLYASLSDTQKHAADALFRQQVTTDIRPRTRR
jgi:hypothetical protein